MSSFFSEEELAQLGLKSYGDNVRISRLARLYGAEFMELGSNVRIDDFSILSASTAALICGDFVHIAAGVYIYGQAGLFIEDHVNLSAGVKIFTITDDFGGNFLVGATEPHGRNVVSIPLTISRHVVIGANSVVLPGAILPEGVAIGACSMVKHACESWYIYAGTPARKLRARGRELLML